MTTEDIQYITDDPRVGKRIQVKATGEIWMVESIIRHTEGYETIQGYNPQTGAGEGGLTSDEIIYLD